MKDFSFTGCGCDSGDEVHDSRLSIDRHGEPFIRRRRVCKQCGKRATTVEIVAKSGRGIRAEPLLAPTEQDDLLQRAKVDLMNDFASFLSKR